MDGEALHGEIIRQYGDKAAKAVSVLDMGFDDATVVLHCPKIPQRLRATSSVDRLNEEVRRRERVIRVFPNRESVVRLMGALLMEQDEKWAAGKQYLDMGEYLNWRKKQLC